MQKEPSLVKQIEFVVTVRRIKLLGIAITVGLIVIFLSGLFVAGSNYRENFEIVNLISLLLLVVIFFLTFFLRKHMLKKVNTGNISVAYFNAHVIPFAVMDFGALFCITTNLFVNGNILYASLGLLISVAGMIINFPNEEYFDKISG
ncbi:MAG: hypothetical protein JNJ56_03560 [Ignavibacteria bacterium]|nr:hypothetical protein [Ignavibacteria bacterium]